MTEYLDISRFLRQGGQIDINFNRKKMENIMPRFLTVVYAVNDEIIFRDELEKMKVRFQENIGQPWLVSAMSTNDEMRRLELIEAALELRDIDLIEEIISHADLTKINDITDFEL